MPDLLLELRSEEIPARMQRKAAGDLKKLITDGLVEAGLTYEGAKEYWTPRRLTLDVRGVTARSKDVREEIKGPSVSAPEQAIQGFLRKAGLADISEAHKHADPKKGEFYVAHLVKPGRAAEEIIAELVPAVVRKFPWPKEMRWGAASGPKGRRYGKIDGKGGETLRWVRPLQSIVCTFGPETEEPVVVDFDIDGIRSGNVTYGHRFMAPGAITVKRFDDYVAKLEAAKVVLDADRRKRIIEDDARNIAFANGLELVEDEGLLEEVSGLVEWPVVIMGEFEQDFLQIPAEVIRLTIKTNQKCFVTAPAGNPSSGPSGHLLPQGEKEGRGAAAGAPSPLVGEGGSARSAETGEGYSLSNRFLLTANIEAKDGGAEIAHGNGKVVRARLSDALYFWKTDQGDLPDVGTLQASAKTFGLDLKKPLDQRMARLDHLNVTFHAKLGTQGERVQRIMALARELAPLVGADPELAARAAALAKADLQTEVVGEFPELQGVMGRKYALLQGEDASVAGAIEEHYKPQGPTDRVPTDPVAIAVALADKLDTLVGFWAIDEKPTGSKDPYALRRAALGVIRIVLENGVRVGLARSVLFAGRAIADHTVDPLLDQSFAAVGQAGANFNDDVQDAMYDLIMENYSVKDGLPFTGDAQYRWRAVANLLSFFHDRLKVYLRDQGARHDLIDAVLGSRPISPLEGEMSAKPTEGGREIVKEPPSALPGISPSRGEISQSSNGNDDLLTIVRRVEALGAFLDTEDGKNLLAGAKRGANILAAEEKKGTAVAAAVDPALFSTGQEKALFAALNVAERDAAQAIQKEDFAAAMRALSALREPVDAFFDGVLVNDEDQAVRANRLALLARIRAATGEVADFSRIAG